MPILTEVRVVVDCITASTCSVTCTLLSKNAFLQKTGLLAACLTIPNYALPRVCHNLLAAPATVPT